MKILSATMYIYSCVEVSYSHIRAWSFLSSWIWLSFLLTVCVCWGGGLRVCACVRACVRARARVCVCVCVLTAVDFMIRVFNLI